MSSVSAPTLANALTDILNAIVDVIDNVAIAVADNASIIADVLIIGGLIFGVMAVWRKFGSSATSFFRGLFT